jgi:hypothetical protein
LIYGEHSELARQIYGEKLPQRIFRNTRTFVNVAQDLRDFGRFEMNKRDLGRQQEDRIAAAEKDIPHEIQKSLSVWVGIVENHLVGLYVLLPPRYGD